ncbi:MAG: hypothetical protein RL660_2980 [Bacteroidota bacterium]|jgi:hypothetical protein
MDLAAALTYFSPKDSTKLSFKKLIEYAWKEFLQQPLFYIAFTVISLLLPIICTWLLGSAHMQAVPIFLIMLCINPPLEMGTAAYLHHKHQTTRKDFVAYFKPFRIELIDLFLFSVVTVAALFLITLPAVTVQVVMENNGIINVDEPLPLSLQLVRIATLIALLFYGVAMMFAPYYIYFNKMKPLKAMRESYATIKVSWFWFLGLYIGISLLMLAGLVAVVVGVLATMPVARIASYYVFAKYSGIDQALEEE